MPTYDCACEDCGKKCEVRASISEYSKGIKPQCPHCGSEKSIRTFTSINVLTARPEGDSRAGMCGPTAGPGYRGS